jgi:hypothetical protein
VRPARIPVPDALRLAVKLAAQFSEPDAVYLGDDQPDTDFHPYRLPHDEPQPDLDAVLVRPGIHAVPDRHPVRRRSDE